MKTYVDRQIANIDCFVLDYHIPAGENFVPGGGLV